MDFVFEGRESESPYVDMLWRTQSGRAETFISAAAAGWEMVLCKQYGKSFFTVRGPETQASLAPVPADAEFFGIHFKLGAFMPHWPTSELVNVGVDLPEASEKRVWFCGAAWELPTFHNADVFVDRLIREGILVFDPVIEDTLKGQRSELSPRSIQRRFVRATGLTQGTIDQIERAQQASKLLEQGISILDTVEQVGYADQPHLTRSLKRFVGRTPAEILRSYWSE
jgi:AraC-like DNA-binding protein